MTTMVRNRRPPRPTAQGLVYPHGQTPPSSMVMQAESGADDREGRLATLGKEQEDRDVLLTIQEICQATGSVPVEGVTAANYDWPISGSTVLVRPAPQNVLDGTEPFDAVILIEAIWPWTKQRDLPPFRAVLRAPYGTLGAILKRLLPWFGQISRQGWRVRALVLYAPHIGVRPAAPERAPTPPATDPLRVLTAILYEEVMAKHVNWVRTHARTVDAMDRLDRLDSGATKGLGQLCAGRINLETFRLRLEFAYRRVIEDYRREQRWSRRLDQFQQDVGRELGWGDTSETLTEDPETELLARETAAEEGQKCAVLIDLIDELAAAEGKTQRAASEYLRKCLADGCAPTGAGLAAYRNVDASVGWRQLKQIRNLLREKLTKGEERSYLKSA